MPDFDDFDALEDFDDYSLSQDLIEDADDDGYFDCANRDDLADAQACLVWELQHGCDDSEVAYWQAEINRLTDTIG